MLDARRLRLDELISAFEGIVPRLERESMRVDETDFRRKFTAFLALARARGNPG